VVFEGVSFVFDDHVVLSIAVNGPRIEQMSEAGADDRRTGIGMLFQESALFDALTVEGNVG
jgi:ABC-type transporter Mla maintaining outer membrane lipid asymmetry ATPase subunit MlaF